MTTVAEVQDLAADIQHLRPDWPDIVPIVNYLLPWRHLDYADLYAAATAWVKDPGNRTPASLKYMTGVPPKSSGVSSNGRKSKEPRCYICGNTRSDCERLHQFETAHGIADPHRFETSDEALAHRSDRQWPDLRTELDRLRAERAKGRADRARAEIRPMKTHRERVAALTPDDAPRRCAGCGGTLARMYARSYHPGCDPDQPQIQEPA